MHDTRVARWCGVYFSLGHGVVVVLVALVAVTFARSWTIPHWFEDVGAWLSIVLLVLLGIVNIAAVINTPADRPVRLAGVKGRFLGRFRETRNPYLIAALGAMFAFSFDTLSQVALFALIGAQIGGWAYCLTLA